jgi:hypothetical protein
MYGAVTAMLRNDGARNFLMSSALCVYSYNLRFVFAQSAGRWAGGFPFTPQLSYNPSNSGDTKNPVRPSRIEISRAVIIASPNEWFNPAAFLARPNKQRPFGATWDSIH